MAWLVVLAGCQGTWQDPDATGIRIRPADGHYRRCQTLEIENRLVEDVRCDLVDRSEPRCGAPLDWGGAIELENLERFAADVCCADVTLTCRDAVHPASAPVRAWTWTVGGDARPVPTADTAARR